MWVQLAPPYVGYAVDMEICLVWQHEGVGESLRKSHPQLVALVELAGGQVFVDELWLPDIPVWYDDDWYEHELNYHQDLGI